MKTETKYQKVKELIRLGNAVSYSLKKMQLAPATYYGLKSKEGKAPKARVKAEAKLVTFTMPNDAEQMLILIGPAIEIVRALELSKKGGSK